MTVCGWALYGAGFAILAIMCYALLGLGKYGYGFCDYFDKMLHDKAEFQRLSAADSQSVFGRLDSCMFGNGNVL
jgi:hypothetical protein